MAVVRIKGLNRVKAKLSDGNVTVYWYAWKGGPRLPGKPGEPQFLAAYNEAVALRKTRPGETLAALATRYKASPEWSTLADATRKAWARWLDRIITDDIGLLTFRMLDDRRVRADLLEWRDQWGATPRTADYAVQVLSRVLSWGIDRGLLERNAMAGVTPLWEADHADEIWTAQEVARFCEAASPEVGFGLRLACLTGFRRADLIKLTWSHVGELEIRKPTSKSRNRREAFVPLLDDTRKLLEEIKAHNIRRREAAIAAKKTPPPEAVTLLTNTRGKPWSADGFETQLIKAKAPGKANVAKRLHDARGTFATRLRIAGVEPSEIAEIMAWEPARVTRILRKYVEAEAVVKALTARITRHERAAAETK